MPIAVVVGPPFSGKSDFARAEIERREQDGERGLALLDYTGIFSAVIPGVQSSFRDAEVADSGAMRFAGYLFALALAQMLDRELSGYVATPNPRRALEISDKAGGAPILDMAASVDQIATRITGHMRDLQKTVPRATRERSVGRCRKAATSYLKNETAIVGRARTVTREGNRFRIGSRKQAFDEQAFLRGLTPRGRAVRDELIEAGHPATPADILGELITERRLGAL